MLGSAGIFTKQFGSTIWAAEEERLKLPTVLCVQKRSGGQTIQGKPQSQRMKGRRGKIEEQRR